MTAAVEMLLQDEESCRALLRMKLLAGKYDYKARIEELVELNDALKAALSQQLVTAKDVVTAFVPVQAHVNTRLTVAVEEAATYRSAEQQLSSELAVLRDHAKTHDYRVDELREALEDARRDRAQSASECAQRMESFQNACKREVVEVADEFQRKLIDLEKREKRAAEQLASALEHEKGLIADVAAKDGLLQAKHCEVQALQLRFTEKDDGMQKLQAELAEAEKSLQDIVAEQNDLRLRYSERESAAELQLREKDAGLHAVRIRLAEVEKALEQSRVDGEAVRLQMEAREAALEAKLREMEDALRRKDDDLRCSMQSINQMHGDSSQQLQSERQRVQKLENELHTVKTSEAALRESLRREVELLRGEAASGQERNSELVRRLQTAESERDNFADIAANNQASFAQQQEELSQVLAKLEARQKEYAAIVRDLDVECQQTEKLSREKKMLELEFAKYRESGEHMKSGQMEVITDLKVTVDRLSKLGDAKQAELCSKHIGVRDDQHVLRLQQQLAAAEQSRREMHNAMQELKGNIRVFCRMRPAPEGARYALDLLEGDKLSLYCQGDTYNFNYDKVFDSSATQVEVFDEVSGLIQSALDGYKVCIFAYGQTGAGKTFTMQGPSAPSSSEGLIPRSLRKIFEASRHMIREGWTWSLQCSFLEVYNESFRDLLSTASGNTSPTTHVVKHDEVWGAIVTNMTIVDVDSSEQIQELMARAARQRAVGAHDANAESSRSHSVFALYLKGTNQTLNTELHGALHLVDLAGSERLGKSGSTGDRLKETQNINRSLSSLVDVFVAKSERRSHVPFRNSKLTHLMEPCLSGQGKTLMLVNVCPDDHNAHETLCSLRFASQVNQCNTGGKAKRSVRGIRDSAQSPSNQRHSVNRMFSASPPPVNRAPPAVNMNGINRMYSHGRRMTQ